MKEVKTETALLFRIYGSIDRKVRSSPETAPGVAALLPAYEDPEEHWADAFPEWETELEGQSEEAAAVSMLHSAVDELGPMELRCRMPARRLFALGAASLAFRGELLERGDEGVRLRDIFRNALTPKEFGGGQETGDQLLEYLLDESALPTTTPGTPLSIAAWWRGLLKKASLERVDGGGIGPPPCSTGLVWTTIEGEDEPVPTFVTEFDVAMSYEQAKEFCDPLRWKCFALWCNMQDRERGKAKHDVIHKYRETVSLDCDRRRSTQTFKIPLDFFTTELPGPPRVSITEYRLSGDNQEDRVRVNAGSLVITELSGGKVHIKTTKRLLFTEPLDGAGFVSTLCHLGYLSNVEDLICCATAEDWQTPFPGRRPRQPPRSPTWPWVDPNLRGLMTFTVRRSEATLVQWLTDFERDYKKSAKKEPSGRSSTRGGYECYTCGDLFDDMVDMWTFAMCEGPKLAVSGLRRSGMAPTDRGRRVGRASRSA